MELLEIEAFEDVIDYLSERDSVEREALQIIMMRFPEREPEVLAMIETGLFGLKGELSR